MKFPIASRHPRLHSLALKNRYRSTQGERPETVARSKSRDLHAEDAHALVNRRGRLFKAARERAD